MCALQDGVGPSAGRQSQIAVKMHAGAEVSRGSEYVLRSDVMYGPSLKEEAEESERVDAYRPRKRDYTV